MIFDSTPRHRRGRVLLAALLGFALTFQALVAAIHVHPLAELGITVLATDDGAAAPGVPKVHDELNCPLCLLLKGGSAYVPPAVVGVVPLPAATLAIPAREAPPARPVARSPVQPRAPPVLV
ncbi:MAG: DUF2946 family protein [Gammaproteobacteria bacterium]|nr:DUF2946 family protein [Gammaproteobacteria bacterium]MBI5615908.1 DUF2946 family protein [Gammaproteobacteria bacterium]